MEARVRDRVGGGGGSLVVLDHVPNPILIPNPNPILDHVPIPIPILGHVPKPIPIPTPNPIPNPNPNPIRDHVRSELYRAERAEVGGDPRGAQHATHGVEMEHTPGKGSEVGGWRLEVGGWRLEVGERCEGV